MKRADHKGAGLESYVTKKEDKTAALAFIKMTMKHYGIAERLVAADVRWHPTATRELDNLDRR